MFDNFGGSELLVVVFVIFILFGPKQLPEIGTKIGKGVREFKDMMQGVQKDIEESMKPGAPSSADRAPGGRKQ